MPFKTTNVGGVLQSQYEQDPRLIMALQGMQQGSSTAPVQSGYEGIARALQGPINAWMAKKLRGEYEDKQAGQYGAIADILAPPTQSSPVIVDSWGPDRIDGITTPKSPLDATPPALPNPNREAIMAAMSAGVVKPETFSTAIADKLGFGKPKDPIKLGRTERLLDASDPTKTLVDALPDEQKPPQPSYNRTIRRGNMDVSQHWDQTKGGYVDDGSGAHFKPEAAPSEDPVSPLSEAAIVNAAVRYNATGTLPPLGMGKQAASLRAQILDTSAKLATGKFTPEQLVANMASYKANAGSLNQQTKVFNAIETSANAAKNSARLAMQAASAGGAGPTSVPAFNRYIQAGRRAIGGDKQVMALENHLSTFAEEYAKVMTASTGSAAATDSARQEAHKRLSSANNLDQLKFLMGEMQKEMGGRHYAARTQIDGTRGQLAGEPYHERDGVQTPAPAATAKNDPLGIR